VPSVSRCNPRVGYRKTYVTAQSRRMGQYNGAIPVINAAGILSLKATMPMLDELIGKFLPDARTSRVSAARPLYAVIRRR